MTRSSRRRTAGRVKKQVLDEVQAQQLLINTASIRGRAGKVLPMAVRPIGSTASDLASVLRHENGRLVFTSREDPGMRRG